MAIKTAIEWTDATWNPVWGCSRCSPGCEHCYAESTAARFANPGLPYHGIARMTKAGPRWTNSVVCKDNLLLQPLHWRKPRKILVNSMSDLFHDNVPFDFIQRVFEVMAGAHWHEFQILTKRSSRLRKLSRHLMWPRNVWMGVSIENAEYVARIDDLQSTGAKTKFLSLEPLLGPLPDLDLNRINWVIVGGESGPKARPMSPEWVPDIREQCLISGVPFFFKQWGRLSNNPIQHDPTDRKTGGNAKGGRRLEGRTWDEMPAIAESGR